MYAPHLECIVRFFGLCGCGRDVADNSDLGPGPGQGVLTGSGTETGSSVWVIDRRMDGFETGERGTAANEDTRGGGHAEEYQIHSRDVHTHYIPALTPEAAL